MTFARRRADTPWVGVLDPVEMQLMDRDISRALDGFAGGAYAPSSVLTIGGSGLTVTALLTASGGLNVAGGIATDSINVTGDVIIIDDLTVFDDLTVQGDASLQGNVDVFGTLDVTGNIDAPTGTIDLLECFAATTGALTVNGLSALTGAVTMTAGGTLSGPLVKSGAGQIRQRIVYGTDTNSTYSVSTADVVVVKASGVGGLSAPRNYAIDDTAAALGSEMEIHNHSSHAITIQNSGFGAIGKCPAATASGYDVNSYPGRSRLRRVDDGFGARWIVVTGVPL